MCYIGSWPVVYAREAAELVDAVNAVSVSGGESQWKQIDIIESGNGPLISAAIHYNSMRN